MLKYNIFFVVKSYGISVITQELTLRNTDLFSISTLFRDKQRLMTAVSMFLEIVQKNDFPEFLTTYLNLDHTFLRSQSQHEDRQTDTAPKARL